MVTASAMEGLSVSLIKILGEQMRLNNLGNETIMTRNIALTRYRYADIQDYGNGFNAVV